VHQCKVLDISSVFSMKIPQDAHIVNVFFCQNPVENCTQIFLQFDVNRDKSDVFRYDRLVRRPSGFPASMFLICFVRIIIELLSMKSI
jgi:hypothetical protein